MIRRSHSAAFAACLTWSALALPGAVQQSVPEREAPAALDPEALARAWLNAHGRAEAASGAESEPSDAALLAPFARLTLGRVEALLLAEELGQAPTAKALRAGLQALLAAQTRWWEWGASAEGTSAAARAQVRQRALELSRWIDSWSPKDLAQLGPDPALDLGAALARAGRPKSPPAQLSAELAQLLERPWLGLGQEREQERTRIVLVAHRESFVGLACAAGLRDESRRQVLWGSELVDWTFYDLNGTRVVALAFREPAGADLLAGVSMQERNARALEEHVAQMAARSLFELDCGRGLDPMLGGALSNLLVIDEYGEIDTRTDGDLRGRATQARSQFVPGGRSEGGLLPPLQADGRWRLQRGAGYFVDELRASQKSGARRGGEPLSAFELLDDSQRRELIRAPILGPQAQGAQGLPPSFELDHAEFLRAYRCAFLHWLQHESAGDQSRAKFASLLAQLVAQRPGPQEEEREAWDDDRGAQGAPDETAPAEFPALVERIWGVPLSGERIEPTNLEGRFLAWLAGAPSAH